MLTAAMLAANQTASNAAIARMEALLAALNNAIERIEGDASRSREYILAACKEARDKATPALAEELKAIAALDASSAPNEQFWQSRPFVLSQQTFDSDPAKDAVIKLQRAAELKNMPAPLLSLAHKNARFDLDLPMVYATWLAGAGRANVEAGFSEAADLSLDGIGLPGQAAALAAISACRSNRSYAESMFSAAAALRSDPVRKLTVGREQQTTSRLVAAASALDPEV